MIHLRKIYLVLLGGLEFRNAFHLGYIRSPMIVEWPET